MVQHQQAPLTCSSKNVNIQFIIYYSDTITVFTYISPHICFLPINPCLWVHLVPTPVFIIHQSNIKQRCNSLFLHKTSSDNRSGPWRLTANHVFSVFLHGQLLHACFLKCCSVALVHHMPVLWLLHTLTMARTACCYTMLVEILSNTGADVPHNTCLGVRCWRWYRLEA